MKAAGGNCFTLAILDDGSVWGFGFNDDGALGLNHRAHQAAPARMMLPPCERPARPPRREEARPRRRGPA